MIYVKKLKTPGRLPSWERGEQVGPREMLSGDLSGEDLSVDFPASRDTQDHGSDLQCFLVPDPSW